MKKIIALLLVLVMATALFACGETADPQLAAFTDAVNASKPAGAEITTTLSTDLGDLTGLYTITYSGNTTTIEYSYEKFNELGEGATEIKATKTGTATVDANGKCSDEEFAADNAIATNFKLNLDAGKFSTFKVDGNTLTAQVAADNVEAVLGFKVSAAVTVVLKKTESNIQSYTLAYNTEVGPATITCTYNY